MAVKLRYCLGLVACAAIASCSMDGRAPEPAAEVNNSAVASGSTGSQEAVAIPAPAMVDRPARPAVPAADGALPSRDPRHMRMAEAARMAEVPLEPCSVYEGAAYNACIARNAEVRRGSQ